MSTPDYLRLHSAALKLAASFEHAFPGGARRRVEWSFLLDVAWKEDIEEDPVVCTPQNRWAAFLPDSKDRHELFEVIEEEIIELRGIIAALCHCDEELRRATEAASPPPRELLLFRELFQTLLRSRWTVEGHLCLEPCDADAFTNVCTVEVRPPNVALVREMARLIDSDGHQSEAATPHEVFVPSAAQTVILTALTGRAMRTDALARVTRIERSTMLRHMKELKKRRLVLNHKKIGFYRPDIPPAILAQSAEVNRRATR